MRGVIFDLDGTLIDTEKLYKFFWMEAARQLGYPMREEHALAIRATDARMAEEILRRTVCPDFDYHRVRALRRELMAVYIDENGVEPKRGMLEALCALRAAGLRIGLATATPPDRVAVCLKSVQAEGFFDAITCAMEVPRGKPAPDIYLRACEKLGIAPSAAVAVEDAPSGVRSAYAAGMRVVMVPDQDEPDAELRAMCAAVVSSLEEIPTLVGL